MLRSTVLDSSHGQHRSPRGSSLGGGTVSTILVVDDEEEIRRLLDEHFGEQGYAVLEAVDGEDALQCVRRDRPDLVLLDIRLP
ncbi:MAG: response regulator, partial [Candidatus Rokubacteria bacterium]|nr:response regulator [Candidatus Rokubacteria bacterium]